MKTNDKNEKRGIVVEIYDHNTAHRVLVVQLDDSPNAHYFSYIPKVPDVNFGDILGMNFIKNRFYVYRGSPRLKYKITPVAFPGTLLMELITERMNL